MSNSGGSVLAKNRKAPRQFGAVQFLTLFLVLDFVIPARLVVVGTGSIGSPATIVGMLGFAWWVVATLAGQRSFVTFNPVRWALFAYLGMLLLSWTLGRMRFLNQFEKTTSDRSFLMMVSLAGVALVAMDGLSSREEVVTVVRRLLYCSMFMVFVGLLQFFFDLDLSKSLQFPGLEVTSEAAVGERSIFNRPYGTALHAIEYGVVAAALVPLAYWIVRVDRRLRFRVILVALAFASLTSISRSAVLTIGVVMIVMLCGVAWRQRLMLVGAGGVFIVVVGSTVNGLVGTLRDLFTTAGNDSSVQARVDRVPKVLQLISEYPFFGRGFGTYNIETYFLLDNELQKTTIETGFIGVAVLILFIGFVALLAWRTRLGDESGQLPGTALAATILGLFISTYTFDAFFYRILTGVLYLCIGLVGALHRVTTVERAQAEDAWFDARLAELEARERRPLAIP